MDEVNEPRQASEQTVVPVTTVDVSTHVAVPKKRNAQPKTPEDRARNFGAVNRLFTKRLKTDPDAWQVLDALQKLKKAHPHKRISIDKFTVQVNEEHQVDVKNLEKNIVKTIMGDATNGTLLVQLTHPITVERTLQLIAATEARLDAEALLKAERSARFAFSKAAREAAEKKAARTADLFVDGEINLFPLLVREAKRKEAETQAQKEADILAAVATQTAELQEQLALQKLGQAAAIKAAVTNATAEIKASVDSITAIVEDIKAALQATQHKLLKAQQVNTVLQEELAAAQAALVKETATAEPAATNSFGEPSDPAIGVTPVQSSYTVEGKNASDFETWIKQLIVTKGAITKVAYSTTGYSIAHYTVKFGDATVSFDTTNKNGLYKINHLTMRTLGDDQASKDRAAFVAEMYYKQHRGIKFGTDVSPADASKLYLALVQARLDDVLKKCPLPWSLSYYTGSKELPELLSNGVSSKLTVQMHGGSPYVPNDTEKAAIKTMVDAFKAQQAGNVAALALSPVEPVVNQPILPAVTPAPVPEASQPWWRRAARIFQRAPLPPAQAVFTPQERRTAKTEIKKGGTNKIWVRIGAQAVADTHVAALKNIGFEDCYAQQQPHGDYYVVIPATDWNTAAKAEPVATAAPRAAGGRGRRQLQPAPSNG